MPYLSTIKAIILTIIGAFIGKKIFDYGASYKASEIIKETKAKLQAKRDLQAIIKDKNKDITKDNWQEHI